MEVRLASIPIDHIEAEVATFPLTSLEAFRLGVTSLNPEMKNPTDELWLKAEAELLNGFPSLSIDEGIALRDFHWFNNLPGKGEIKLYEYLHNLAKRYLESHGGVAIPSQDDDKEIPSPLTPDEARWSLRWLTFAVPSDLLLSALSLDNRLPDNHLPTKISQFSPHLFKMLEDRHFTEPHLHINAGLDFSHAWASLMWTLADYKNLKEKAFDSPGAIFGNGKYFGKWLIRAAIMRYILAEFLSTMHIQEDRRKSKGFFDFLARQINSGYSGLHNIMGTADLLSRFRQLMGELCAGKLQPDDPDSDFTYWQAVYAALTQPSTDKITHANLQSLDPVSAFFPQRHHDDLTPEMLFTRAGLKYMSLHGGKDALFESLFWQIQRLRIFFYRHVTQRPMTPGLLWFVRFYSRLAPAKIPRMSTRIQTAARVDGLLEGLKSFEVRTAPGFELSETIKDLNDIIDGFNGINKDILKECGDGFAGDDGNNNDMLQKGQQAIRRMPVECGILYHFPKDRGGEASKGKPKAFWKDSNADPFNDAKSGKRGRQFFRYEHYYRTQRNKALVLAKIIRQTPYVLNTIRGIDICTDELGVPTWVFVPIFRYLRDTSEIAAASMPSIDSADMSLRTTVHAGEDFVHLATGLRRADEIRRFLLLKDGDRIGHGMSLGVEPAEWSERAGNILMSKEDRLMDLLWEYMWYAEDGLGTSADRALFLEHRIVVLGKYIFDGKLVERDCPLRAKDLLDFYKCLHDVKDNEKYFRAIGFPDSPRKPESDSPNSPVNLVWAYLTDRDLFNRGRELIRVDPKHDVKALAGLQRAVKIALSRLNITVEVNPSSNLLIGNLADFRKHPLWRIMPVDETSEEPSVSICIGSDDPLTFNTNVRMEYQYLSDALARAGFSEKRRNEWLEQVRRNGLDARFTLPYRGPHRKVYDYEKDASPIMFNLPEPIDMP